MRYIVSGSRTLEVSPSSIVEEILQNCYTLLSTVQGEVPLYRLFGVSNDFLDKPIPVAESLLTTSVLEALDTFEPRAKLISATFTSEASGKMIPVIEVEINE